jgi:lipopolysaccharide/colanic/teichoic acid biosynthesis glycosyltransferase
MKTFKRATSSTSAGPASADRLPPRVLDHFAAFESPWGRRRHQLYLGWKRLMWRWLVGGAYATKRVFDFIGSAAALLLLSPLFALIALLIKLEDGRPILFRQVRVGRHGREFLMLKFRSMRVGAETGLTELLTHNKHEVGVTFKLRQDPRVTVMGKWIRRFSFDELPQFWNVFQGDMSLVGPRPPLPREVALYSLADRRRLAVKPGITCLWQISGRAEIDFPGQVLLDIRYIESRSFWQDIKILCKTIPAVLSGTGAY